MAVLSDHMVENVTNANIFFNRSTVAQRAGKVFFFFFFNVGPPKEDIFLNHLLWSIFHFNRYMLQIYISCGPLRAAFMYCFNFALKNKRERESENKSAWTVVISHKWPWTWYGNRVLISIFQFCRVKSVKRYLSPESTYIKVDNYPRIFEGSDHWSLFPSWKIFINIILM